MNEDAKVEEYVQRQGWAVQKEETLHGVRNLVLKACPLCHKSSNKRTQRLFYIEIGTGRWVTNCCQEKGNIITLKRRLGDIDFMRPAAAKRGSKAASKLSDTMRRTEGYDARLLPHPGSVARYEGRLWSDDGAAALAYMRGRGFTDETIKHFQVGLARRGYCKPCEAQTSLADGDTCPKCRKPVRRVREMLALPFVVDNRVVNFKFRSIPPDEKRFERWTGAPTVPFNVDSLGGEFKRVVLAEGEMDIMALHQVGYVVGCSFGGAGKALDDEWLEKLAIFDEVLLGYDNDKAGVEGADKRADELGKYRVRRIEFPFNDANECIMAGMPDADIRACVEAAADYRIGSVKPIGEFKEDMLRLKDKGDSEVGNATRWRGVNQLLGGIRPGELTVVTGGTGSGKSTWTEALLWDQARGDKLEGRDGVGCLIGSFEMTPTAVVQGLVTMDQATSFKALTREEVGNAMDRLGTLDVFVIDHYGRIPLSDLRDGVEFGVRRYGLRLVVLDHLHFMLDTTPDRERFDIETMMLELKRWTLHLGIHIVLVVHPRKLGVFGGTAAKVEINDLRGSSTIAQTADNVLRIWRPSLDDKPPGVPPFTEVAALKVRSHYGEEGICLLAFNKQSLRYEYDPDLLSKLSKGKSDSKGGNGKAKAKGKAKPQSGFDWQSAAAGDDTNSEEVKW